jgi:dipeptidyl-peptidase-4
LICTLEQADWSELLKTGWRVPEPFSAKGRDGVTDIQGVIYRPTNFDPARKYPVIENIYAGPQDAHVPKAFSTLDGSQKLAELGFVVVRIDGIGTSNRSKAFHDVCWKNIGDAGFPDRIAWIKAAAAKYPSLDLSRVGIYGTSAGAQNAMRALIAHGDFYKAAVADCGCHDNRMDKIWWNELWMGWPVGPHYAEQSNVTQAHKMQGSLLLLVGEMDRNVVIPPRRCRWSTRSSKQTRISRCWWSQVLAMALSARRTWSGACTISLCAICWGSGRAGRDGG